MAKRKQPCDHEVCSKSVRVDVTPWGNVGCETFCGITRRRATGGPHTDGISKTPQTFTVKSGKHTFRIRVTEVKP